MAGLTPAVCRSALKAFLEGIPDIGRVHPQRRGLKTEADVRALMMSDVGGSQAIRAWMISPATATTTVTQRHPGHIGIGVSNTQSNDITTVQWSLEGYLSVIDAVDSEQVAFDLAWTIIDRMNSYGIIPGVTGAHMQLAADIESFQYAMLAGMFLCHYVRINTGFTGRMRN